MYPRGIHVYGFAPFRSYRIPRPRSKLIRKAWPIRNILLVMRCDLGTLLVASRKTSRMLIKPTQRNLASLVLIMPNRSTEICRAALVDRGSKPKLIECRVCGRGAVLSGFRLGLFIARCRLRVFNAFRSYCVYFSDSTSFGS